MFLILLLNWLSALPNAGLEFWLKFKALSDIEGLKFYFPGSFPKEATKDVLFQKQGLNLQKGKDGTQETGDSIQTRGK